MLMKCFYYSQYKFYAPKYKDGLKFLLLSDVHFSPHVKASTLSAVVAQAKKLSPDYIFISGDIVDSLDYVNTDAKMHRLTAWLTRLGQVAPTLIVLGNHDFYHKNPDFNGVFSKKRHWYAHSPAHLVKAINAIDNVQLLDNTSYEDKNVYVFGFTQTPEYFNFDRDENHTTSIFHPGSEDKNIMIYDLHQLNHKLIEKLPKRKVKIALIHSPVFLHDSEITSYLYEFDFFISGHMHNGVVPPVISDFWRSDRGILAPGKHLFPRYARSHITEPDEKSIICGAVTTIQASAKPLTFMNRAYPVNIATLELSHNELLARKPDVKNQYISF